MADTWGKNPYRPYTQQAAAWERQQVQQEADEQRRFYDRMAEAQRSHAQQMENMRQQTRLAIPPTRAVQAPRVANPTPERSVTGRNEATVRGAGGGGGLAMLGAVIGLFLAAGAGASVLGGLLIGGVLGALLVPAIKLVGWLTVTLVKIALAAIVILFLLAALGSLAGGG